MKKIILVLTLLFLASCPKTPSTPKVEEHKDQSFVHKEKWNGLDFEMMDRILAELQAGKLPDLLRPNVETALNQLHATSAKQPQLKNEIDEAIKEGEHALESKVDPGPNFFLKVASFSSGKQPPKIDFGAGKYLTTFEDVSIEVLNRTPPGLYYLAGTTKESNRFDARSADPLEYFIHDVQHSGIIENDGLKRYLDRMLLQGIEKKEAIALIRNTQKKFSAQMDKLVQTEPQTVKAIESLIFFCVHEFGSWSDPQSMLNLLNADIIEFETQQRGDTIFGELELLSEGALRFNAETQRKATAWATAFLEQQKPLFYNMAAAEKGIDNGIKNPTQRRSAFELLILLVQQGHSFPKALQEAKSAARIDAPEMDQIDGLRTFTVLVEKGYGIEDAALAAKQFVGKYLDYQNLVLKLFKALAEKDHSLELAEKEATERFLRSSYMDDVKASLALFKVLSQKTPLKVAEMTISAVTRRQKDSEKLKKRSLYLLRKIKELRSGKVPDWSFKTARPELY